MAELDISEKRIPQDGRIQMCMEGRDIDIRVSCIPTFYGENVVLRLLDRSRGIVELKQLGFPSTILGQYKKIISRPHGIVLVCGPTGSGKTTTLYASLKAINDETKNIITIEDPIEYNLAKSAGELRALVMAVESFYIHNDKVYPVQTTAVDSEWQNDANSLTASSPTIIKSVLVDPFKPSQEYSYATSASSGSLYYVVFSVGPDGTADITGVDTAGEILGDPDDDIYISNGTSGTGGF